MLTFCSEGDVITSITSSETDCIADFCHKVCLSPQIENGSGILPKDQSISCPAAFDTLSKINPLNLQFLQVAATLEMMRNVPLEDGHASLWLWKLFGGEVKKLLMYF